MSADSPAEVIDQHIADDRPNKDTEELVAASEKLVARYDSTTRAAEETDASRSALSQWTRLGRLPDGILGHVYMGELPQTSADIIRRIESGRNQRLISIATIQESLGGEYVKLLENEISDEEKTAEEAIESELGEVTKLRSVTLGFDRDTYLRLWSVAGRRRCSVSELCEELITERLDRIDDEQIALRKATQMQDATHETLEEVTDFIETLEEFDGSIDELHENK